jgi:membrane-associated phospholipid phosphatase
MNDSYILRFFIGLITLQLIVKVAKKIIKQKRPILSKTYGMPSSKAATLFYIITYFMINNNLLYCTKMKLIILAFIGIYSKYYVKEHSMIQLLVGGLVGIGYSYFISMI